jgi:hypothetical protein
MAKFKTLIFYLPFYNKNTHPKAKVFLTDAGLVGRKNCSFSARAQCH